MRFGLFLVAIATAIATSVSADSSVRAESDADPTAPYTEVYRQTQFIWFSAHKFKAYAQKYNGTDPAQDRYLIKTKLKFLTQRFDEAAAYYSDKTTLKKPSSEKTVSITIDKLKKVPKYIIQGGDKVIADKAAYQQAGYLDDFRLSASKLNSAVGKFAVPYKAYFAKHAKARSAVINQLVDDIAAYTATLERNLQDA